MFKAVRNTVASRIVTVTSLCLVVLLMGVFFAAQSYSTAIAAVSINKQEPVEEKKWDICIVGNFYKETEGSIPSEHKILSNVVLNKVTLNNPGEFIEYTFKIDNNGNMDGVLKNILVEGTNEKVSTTIKVNSEDYDKSKEKVLSANSENYVTVRIDYLPNEQIVPVELNLVTTVQINQK